VLGNLLGLQGFQHETADEVRAEALGDPTKLAARLDNTTNAAIALPDAATGLQRLADVPIYATDALVRRAPALQATADAKLAAHASLPTALWQQLGLCDADRVRVSQGGASAELPARLDARLPANVVRVPAGLAETATLGAMFGAIVVEKA
jgi:NADH-quinone oxidoreductase subunit G